MFGASFFWYEHKSVDGVSVSHTCWYLYYWLSKPLISKFKDGIRSRSILNDWREWNKCVTEIAVDAKCRNIIGRHHHKCKSVWIKKIGLDIHYTGISFRWFGLYHTHTHTLTSTVAIVAARAWKTKVSPKCITFISINRIDVCFFSFRFGILHENDRLYLYSSLFHLLLA